MEVSLESRKTGNGIWLFLSQCYVQFDFIISLVQFRFAIVFHRREHYSHRRVVSVEFDIQQWCKIEEEAMSVFRVGFSDRHRWLHFRSYGKRRNFRSYEKQRDH